MDESNAVHKNRQTCSLQLRLRCSTGRCVFSDLIFTTNPPAPIAEAEQTQLRVPSSPLPVTRRQRAILFLFLRYQGYSSKDEPAVLGFAKKKKGEKKLKEKETSIWKPFFFSSPCFEKIEKSQCLLQRCAHMSPGLGGCMGERLGGRGAVIVNQRSLHASYHSLSHGAAADTVQHLERALCRGKSATLK